MLRNCPFGQLSKSHVELVCGLNYDLIDGLLEGLGQGGGEALLAPQDGRCCVVIRHCGAPRCLDEGSGGETAR